jgi:hypothetical protein
MVIEIFGYSPRAGLPDTHLYTFGSQVRRSRREGDFVTRQAYDAYVANNPNNESAFVYPIEAGEWQSASDEELLSRDPCEVLVRGKRVVPPGLNEYSRLGIKLESPHDAHVFEFCRWLAATARESVLATAEERRVCLSSELVQILLLEEWRHPDLAKDERPSDVRTFQMLAETLLTGDVERYRPAEPSNTHWMNWPDGGSL